MRNAHTNMLNPSNNTQPHSQPISNQSYLYNVYPPSSSKWSFLESINISSISLTRDQRKLKEFSNKFMDATELPWNNPDQLQKLFSLVQLTIEASQKVNKKLITRYRENQTEISKLKNEIQQIHTKPIEFIGSKCPICLGSFESLEYLDVHISQKHHQFISLWNSMRHGPPLPTTNAMTIEKPKTNEIPAIFNELKTELEKTQKMNEEKMIHIFSEKISTVEKNFDAKMTNLRNDTLAQTMPYNTKPRVYNERSQNYNRPSNSRIQNNVNFDYSDNIANPSSDSLFEFSPDPSDANSNCIEISSINNTTNRSTVKKDLVDLDIPYLSDIEPQSTSTKSKENNQPQDEAAGDSLSNKSKRKKIRRRRLVIKPTDEINESNQNQIKENQEVKKGIEISIDSEESQNTAQPNSLQLSGFVNSFHWPITLNNDEQNKTTKILSIEPTIIVTNRSKSPNLNATQPATVKKPLIISEMSVLLDTPLSEDENEIFQSPQRKSIINQRNRFSPKSKVISYPQSRKVSQILHFDSLSESDSSEKEEVTKKTNKKHSKHSKSKRKPIKIELSESYSNDSSSTSSDYKPKRKRSRSTKHHKRSKRHYDTSSSLSYSESTYDDEYESRRSKSVKHRKSSDKRKQSSKNNDQPVPKKTTNLQISEDLVKLDEIKEKVKPKLKICNYLATADQPLLLSESSESSSDHQTSQPFQTPSNKQNPSTTMMNNTSSLKDTKIRNRTSSNSNHISTNHKQQNNNKNTQNEIDKRSNNDRNNITERSPKINSLSDDDSSITSYEPNSIDDDLISVGSLSSGSSAVDQILYSSDTYKQRRQRRSQIAQRSRTHKIKNDVLADTSYSVSPASFITPTKEINGNEAMKRKNFKEITGKADDRLNNTTEPLTLSTSKKTKKDEWADIFRPIDKLLDKSLNAHNKKDAIFDSSSSEHSPQLNKSDHTQKKVEQLNSSNSESKRNRSKQKDEPLNSSNSEHQSKNNQKAESRQKVQQMNNESFNSEHKHKSSKQRDDKMNSSTQQQLNQKNEQSFTSSESNQKKEETSSNSNHKQKLNQMNDESFSSSYSDNKQKLHQKKEETSSLSHNKPKLFRKQNEIFSSLSSESKLNKQNDETFSSSSSEHIVELTKQKDQHLSSSSAGHKTQLSKQKDEHFSSSSSSRKQKLIHKKNETFKLNLQPPNEEDQVPKSTDQNKHNIKNEKPISIGEFHKENGQLLSPISKSKFDDISSSEIEVETIQNQASPITENRSNQSKQDNHWSPPSVPKESNSSPRNRKPQLKPTNIKNNKNESNSTEDIFTSPVINKQVHLNNANSSQLNQHENNVSDHDEVNQNKKAPRIDNHSNLNQSDEIKVNDDLNSHKEENGSPDMNLNQQIEIDSNIKELIEDHPLQSIEIQSDSSKQQNLSENKENNHIESNPEILSDHQSNKNTNLDNYHIESNKEIDSDSNQPDYSIHNSENDQIKQNKDDLNQPDYSVHNSENDQIKQNKDDSNQPQNSKDNGQNELHQDIVSNSHKQDYSVHNSENEQIQVSNQIVSDSNQQNQEENNQNILHQEIVFNQQISNENDQITSEKETSIDQKPADNLNLQNLTEQNQIPENNDQNQLNHQSQSDQYYSYINESSTEQVPIQSNEMPNNQTINSPLEQVEVEYYVEEEDEEEEFNSSQIDQSPNKELKPNEVNSPNSEGEQIEEEESDEEDIPNHIHNSPQEEITTPLPDNQNKENIQNEHPNSFNDQPNQNEVNLSNGSDKQIEEEESDEEDLPNQIHNSPQEEIPAPLPINQNPEEIQNQNFINDEFDQNPNELNDKETHSIDEVTTVNQNQIEEKPSPIKPIEIEEEIPSEHMDVGSSTDELINQSHETNESESKDDQQNIKQEPPVQQNNLPTQEEDNNKLEIMDESTFHSSEIFEESAHEANPNEAETKEIKDNNVQSNNEALVETFDDDDQINLRLDDKENNDDSIEFEYESSASNDAKENNELPSQTDMNTNQTKNTILNLDNTNQTKPAIKHTVSDDDSFNEYAYSQSESFKFEEIDKTQLQVQIDNNQEDESSFLSRTASDHILLSKANSGSVFTISSTNLQNHKHNNEVVNNQLQNNACSSLPQNFYPPPQKEIEIQPFQEPNKNQNKPFIKEAHSLTALDPIPKEPFNEINSLKDMSISQFQLIQPFKKPQNQINEQQQIIIDDKKNLSSESSSTSILDYSDDEQGIPLSLSKDMQVLHSHSNPGKELNEHFSFSNRNIPKPLNQQNSFITQGFEVDNNQSFKEYQLGFAQNQIPQHNHLQQQEQLRKQQEEQLRIQQQQEQFRKQQEQFKIQQQQEQLRKQQEEQLRKQQEQFRIQQQQEQLRKEQEEQLRIQQQKELRSRLPPGFGRQSILASMDDPKPQQQQQKFNNNYALGNQDNDFSRRTLQSSQPLNAFSNQKQVYPGFGPALSPMEDTQTRRSFVPFGFNQASQSMNTNNQQKPIPFSKVQSNDDFGNKQLHHSTDVNNGNRKSGIAVNNGIGHKFNNNQNLMEFNQQNVNGDNSFLPLAGFNDNQPSNNGFSPLTSNFSHFNDNSFGNKESNWNDGKPKNGIQRSKPISQNEISEIMKQITIKNQDQNSDEQPIHQGFSDSINQVENSPFSEETELSQQSPVVHDPTKKLKRSKPFGTVSDEVPFNMFEDEELMAEINNINKMNDEYNESHEEPVNTIPLTGSPFQMPFQTQNDSSQGFNYQSDYSSQQVTPASTPKGFSVVNASGNKSRSPFI